MVREVRAPQQIFSICQFWVQYAEDELSLIISGIQWITLSSPASSSR